MQAIDSKSMVLDIGCAGIEWCWCIADGAFRREGISKLRLSKNKSSLGISIERASSSFDECAKLKGLMLCKAFKAASYRSGIVLEIGFDSSSRDIL